MEWPAAAPPAVQRAVMGALAALTTLSVGSLAAVVLPNGVSPESAIGEQLISLAPANLRESAISLLGTRDKPAIVIITIALCSALVTILGLAARRTRLPLIAGIVLLVALFVTAATESAPAAAGSSVLGGLLAGSAGVATLALLARFTGLDNMDGRDKSGLGGDGTAYSRRQFVTAAVLLAGAALLVGGAATALARGMQSSVESLRRAIRLPRVSRPLPPVPTSAAFDVPGLSPLVTPNADFYRIDTALDVPQVDPGTWQLHLTGMVRAPFTLSYAQLLAMPQVESDITLCCVSDPVGGPLISSARWQGVRLADLLSRAGVSAGANQVVGRSVDGFSAGFPVAAALDGRDALVAVGMNGEPLPLEHGFPARLVVPGLYGYVSATKWLTIIELTTFESVGGFWVDRGWAPAAPIRTESRIDVPSDGSQLARGTVVIAGVAWAQHRGIKGVEVRVDGQAWRPADTANALSIDTWRQWRLRWDATPGQHTIEVRAIDATGLPQVPQTADPFPAGATGYHTIAVTVG
ncbi:MAG: molybdopterin-dependent oxidoreductase [Candidatus Dormibacteraeota bacterium]|nr:molybdopterin-dependent oxidoreductase [Candidatus Dormibacteraeota bacterium]